MTAMDDTISRQAAIDELKRISFSHWFECGEYLLEDTREIEIISSSKALEAIEALPSVQPEIIRCKDCCFCNLEYDDDDNQYYSCTARFDESGFWDEVEAEDFCSWAKRRTDGLSISK